MRHIILKAIIAYLVRLYNYMYDQDYAGVVVLDFTVHQQLRSCRDGTFVRNFICET